MKPMGPPTSALDKHLCVIATEIHGSYPNTARLWKWTLMEQYGISEEHWPRFTGWLRWVGANLGRHVCPDGSGRWYLHATPKQYARWRRLRSKQLDGELFSEESAIDAVIVGDIVDDPHRDQLRAARDQLDEIRRAL